MTWLCWKRCLSVCKITEWTKLWRDGIFLPTLSNFALRSLGDLKISRFIIRNFPKLIGGEGGGLLLLLTRGWHWERDWQSDIRFQK